jgi:hypothetical protein
MLLPAGIPSSRPMFSLFLAAVIAVLAPVAPQGDQKKIPDDSVEIATTGCLKGRVFTATQPSEDGLRRGPNVTGRSFRLTGKHDLMEFVKTHDGDLVEIVGLVRKQSLRDNAPGARIGNTRIVVGAPRSGDPMQSARQPISEGIAVMDASSVRFLSDRCPLMGGR